MEREGAQLEALGRGARKKSDGDRAEVMRPSRVAARAAAVEEEEEEEREREMEWPAMELILGPNQRGRHYCFRPVATDEPYAAAAAAEAPLYLLLVTLLRPPPTPLCAGPR